MKWKFSVKPIMIMGLGLSWLLTGWPVVWDNPRFPPEIELAQANTATRTFTFDSSVEGWSFTNNNTTCSGTFVSGAGNPSGSLQISGSKSGGGVTCLAYWEWSGTWQDLGVPVDVDVIGVTGSYQYAVSDDSSNGTWDTGSFELRDSSGNLRQTLVTSLANQTGTVGFTTRTGSQQSFTNESSSTSVRLRVYTGVSFGGGARNWTGQQDNVAVTIEYLVAPDISITVSDGVVTYGTVYSGQSTDTISLTQTQTVENNSNVSVNIDIRTSAPSGWSLGLGSGTDVFAHAYSVNSGENWTFFSEADVYQALVTGLGVSSNQDFDLLFVAPNPSTDLGQKTIVVTLRASEN